MSTPDEFQPVRVHIAGSDLVAAVAKERPPRLAIATHTISLSATNPILALCGHEPNRTLVQLLVLDNPVVICDSYGQATSAANTSAALLNPEGSVLPVSTNLYDIPTTDELWVTAPTLPARVTVILISEAMV